MTSRITGWAAALFCSLVLTLPAAAQEASGLRLDLNIPALRVAVYDGDQLIKSYRVAVGKPGYDTPSGTFNLDHAEWNPWWRPPPGREWTRGREVTPPGPTNPMGRVKLFFAPLYFIHGTPEAETIGSPASHGCVRMRNADVIELARLVHERAAPQVSSREIDRILAQPRNTRVVRFQKPVEVVIRYDPVVVEDGQLRIYPDIYRYGRIHREAVFQAMLTAGYEVHSVDAAAVAEVLERAARQRTSTFSIAVADAFPGARLAVGTASR
jgi:murein L,D-transpeptidase YcbB/YkuD